MTTASKYILAKILSNGDATVKANLPGKCILGRTLSVMKVHFIFNVTPYRCKTVKLPKLT